MDAYNVLMDLLVAMFSPVVWAFEKFHRDRFGWNERLEPKDAFNGNKCILAQCVRADESVQRDALFPRSDPEEEMGEAQ